MSSVLPVSVAPTAQRIAEPSSFESALKAAGRGALGGVAATVALAAPILPGGPILAGAVRNAVAGAASSAAAAGTAVPIGSAPPAAGSDLLEATRALQLQSQSMNLQYLQLQEAMQRESREFTAISNVMKSRHDSAKSAIGNIH